MNASLLKVCFYSFFNMVRRSIPLILAAVMLFNLTGEAVAQINTPSAGQFLGNGGAAVSQPFSFASGYPFPSLSNLDNLDKEQLQANMVFASLSDKLNYEQFKAEVKKTLGTVVSSNVGEEVYQAGFDIYKSGIVAHEQQIRNTAAYLKKAWPYNIGSAYYAKPAAKNGKICETGGQCFDEVIYNHALLRLVLNNAIGSDEANKDWQWNDEIMLASIKPIYYLTEESGVDGNDAALLRKYFTALVSKTEDFCDNDIYKAEIVPGLANADDRANALKGKEQRAKACRGAGYAMAGLAIMESNHTQKDEVAALIYNALKESYRDDYGAVVLASAIPALMAIGTNNAYSYIEKFVLAESLNDGLSRGSAWQVLGKTLDIISIKAWVDKATDANNRLRGRGGRFLNKVGIKMQYLDEETAREFGYSNFSISVVKDGHTGYNMPYGNIWEDIGYMLSASPDNRAKKIAQNAVNYYANSFKQSTQEVVRFVHDMPVTTPVATAYESVHIPLVVGAIKGGGVAGQSAKIAVEKLYNLDWWDLNEGTQRRINNLMAKTGNKYTSSNMSVKAADEVKKARAEQNSRIGEMAVWADMAVSAIMLTSLIASIPSMVKGASGLISTASRVRAVRLAGKSNLLKSVSANIKAGGVKPAAVKAALQAKYNEQAVLARSEVLRAQKGIKKGADGVATPKPALSPAQTSAGAAASRASAAEKVRAVNGSKQSGTIQYTLIEHDVKAADFLGRQKATITATVGEGGGGAVASAKAAPLSKAQRAFITNSDLQKNIALSEEAMSILSPVSPKPFKGNWLFNRPYSQLPSWKKFAFDTWYWNVNPALSMAGDLLRLPLKNPKAALMGATMPVGTTMQIANPIAIYSSIGQGVRTSAVITTSAQQAAAATNAVKTIGTTSYGLAGSLKPITLVKGLNTANPLAIKAFVPQIIGVLNEFHGGPSAPHKLSSGAYYTSYTGNVARVNAEVKANPILLADEKIKPAAVQKETLADEKIKPAAVQKETLTQEKIAVPYKGYKGFEQALREQMKKLSLTKSNKERHANLLSIAPYISPKLATELLKIVDINPQGYTVFDDLVGMVGYLIPELKEGQFVTLNLNRLPKVKRAQFNSDYLINRLIVDDNPFVDLITYVTASANKMVVNMANKYSDLSPAEKEKALNTLLDIHVKSMASGAPTRPYLSAQSGAKHEWEDVSASSSLNFALGKEVKGDFYNESDSFRVFSKTKNYREFLREYTDWLATKLGLTAQNPGVWFENKEGAIFIYNNAGTVRFRAGRHETLLASNANYHFHIEYLNREDGNWTGPMNYNFRWPSQDLLPSDLMGDMILKPIATLARRRLLVEKQSLKPVPSTPLNKPTYGYHPKYVFNNFMGKNFDGAPMIVFEAAPQNLIAITQVPTVPQWLAAPYQVAPTVGDPLSLAGLIFLPWFFKSKAPATRRQVANDQSFSSVVQSDSAGEFVTIEGEDGYGLSYEDPVTGKETLLPVNVKLDKRLAMPGYNRVTFNKNDIAELRDGAAKPQELSHFYMALDNAKGELKAFIASIVKAKLSDNFNIKIEDKHSGARKTINTQLYSAKGSKVLPVNIQIDAKLMPNENARIVLMPSGKLGILSPWKRVPEQLDATIRIPKNQIANLVPVLKGSPISFNITLAPTEHKANVVIRDVSITNVSLGKTFAPVVKTSLGMTEADATSLMFVLNYLLPGLSSFLNPILRKYGEKKILLTSLAFSTLAGLIAVSAGFWGHVESLPPATYRTVAFSAAITLMAVAGILKQLVSNMLIKANRGDTSDKQFKKDAAKAAADAKAAQVAEVTFSDVQKRLKEVLFKKSTLSLQDAFYYNLSFIWKNAGTLKFLALPYAINESIKLVFGVDMGFDFSLSFPIYTAFSAYTFAKVWNTNLRDAYTTAEQDADKLAGAKIKAEREALYKDLTTVGKMLEKSKYWKKDFSKEALLLWDVLAKKKHVWQVSAAMVFATVHEFVMSSTFASQLNASFEDGAAANFFVALCLYIPLVFGRILGNTVGKKITPASLYIICSILSAVGTTIMMGGAAAPAVTMAGAALASLGVGNFFTQMYDYITSMHRNHNREISVILALTMTTAAVMSLPVRYIAEDSGIANIDLMIAMGALVASLALTLPMMKGSTMYKYLKGRFGNNGENAHKQNEGDNNNPTDMNNPLPN